MKNIWTKNETEKWYEINLLTYRNQVRHCPPPLSRIIAFAKFICYTGIEPN